MSAHDLTIRGTWTAIVTPFGEPDGGDPPLDLDGLDDLVEAQIAGGVDVLVPCGTTGESPTLSHAEHDQVVERVVARAAGRVPVVAGAGSNSTREAVRLVRAAAEAGADGVLVVSPYYNRPSQRMLYDHFSVVAGESSLPLVLYNIPSRCGVNLEPETVARLFEACPRVVGLKAAAGSIPQVARVRQLCAIGILSGDDGLTLPMMTVGATGVISVTSNVAPAAVSALVRAALEGDLAGAGAAHARLLPLFQTLFVEPNPVPVKCALRLMGRGNGLVRRPLLPALAGTEDALRPLLADLGLL